jgi:hypothetical protein
MEKNVIKCKLCNWTCQKGWKTKDGKYRSGQWMLIDHYMKDHQEEYLKLQSRLNDEFAFREKDDV